MADPADTAIHVILFMLRLGLRMVGRYIGRGPTVLSVGRSRTRHGNVFLQRHPQR